MSRADRVAGHPAGVPGRGLTGTSDADISEEDHVASGVAPGGLRPSEIVRRSAEYLARHGIESPRENAETLLKHVLGTDRAGLYSRREGLDSATARLFGRALCLRCKAVPLQHLTGEQDFMGLRLQVAPGVFVPRPETELLVEAALAVLPETPVPVVVDAGTGTGAIALAVKHMRPDARVVATDVSEAGIALCQANATRHGLNLEIVLGDLLTGVPAELMGRVDVVVSNPPYLTADEYADLPEEVRADPHAALVGGTELHERLAAEAPRWLAPGGWLLTEIGPDQREVVRAFFEPRFDQVEVMADLAGRDRIVRGRLPGTRAPHG